MAATRAFFWTAALAFQARAAEPLPGLQLGDMVPTFFLEHLAGPDKGAVNSPI